MSLNTEQTYRILEDLQRNALIFKSMELKAEALTTIVGEDNKVLCILADDMRLCVAIAKENMDALYNDIQGMKNGNQ